MRTDHDKYCDFTLDYGDFTLTKVIKTKCWKEVLRLALGVLIKWKGQTHRLLFCERICTTCFLRHWTWMFSTLVVIY